MKRRIRNIPRPLSNPSKGLAGGWIVFLLLLLVGINALDLYLEHFAPLGGEVLGELAAQRGESAFIEEKPSVDSPVREPQKVEAPPQEKPQTDQSIAPFKIRVEVLNGCGVRGIAARARGVLRDRGFDVMKIGNAQKQDYNNTSVIVRSGGKSGEEAAKVVAKSIGLDQSHIRTEIDPSLVDIDVTIILGSDYRNLNL